MDFRYIAIEGTIGVGKSRLADRLGSRLDATIVLDDTDNPFLADAQAGRAGAAFQAQLFFTLGSHRQQTSLRQSDLFSQLTVCDYLFERDKIYAYLNLDDNELFIYQQLYELLSPDLPVPDLVIYLQTPTDVLRRRVREHARANPDATRLDDGYLRELNEAYNHFFFHYAATPLLVVETSQFDLDVGRRGRRRPGTSARDHASRHAVLRPADERQQVIPAARGSRPTPDGRVGRATGVAAEHAKLHRMAWFKKVRKPIEPPDQQSRVPEGLWVKCPSCGHVIYNKDLAASLSVCTKCGHHFRLSSTERLRTLFDAEWTEYDRGLASTDPLSFTDTKPYRKRLDASMAATGLKDAVITAVGQINGIETVVAAMEYGFIGGSMGVVVGEKITRASSSPSAGRCR